MTPTIFWMCLVVTMIVGIAVGVTIARLRAPDSATPQDERGSVVMPHELRRALDRDEFVLQSQPKVELGTDRVTCLEALERWQHPERGSLRP